MTDISIHNFNEKFPEIKRNLEKARFIAIDLEYSALYPLKNEAPSLFDTTPERYDKLRKNLEFVTPVQIGLTAFLTDSTTYTGTIYNFYVVPTSFATIEKPFYFQPGTLSFLKLHGYDFNKFVYSGIPFMNKTIENTLRNTLKSGVSETSSIFKHELQDIYELQINTVLKRWYSTAKEGDSIKLSEIYKKYENCYEIVYFIHKYIRKKFQQVWTCIENDEFIVKKVTNKELITLNHRSNLEENLISDLLGFTKIFQLLTSLKKPLIGHNLCQDILLMYESFEQRLPNSYTEFKRHLHQLFPVIFDTRVVAYDIQRNLIPKDKQWGEKGLQSIFDYFKNGTGRHLALNSPAIEADKMDSYGRFHEAGWDSFCTGYIFIRMAYLAVHDSYPKSKTFVASELVAGLSHLKNQVNVIRGFNSTMCIDGDDPASTRPPLLVLESLKSKSIDIQQVMSILSSCGFVEVKKLPYTHKRALIAVDNFGSARRIINHFQNNKEFNVMPYSTIRHSPLAKTLILGSLTISGAVLAWMWKKS